MATRIATSVVGLPLLLLIVWVESPYPFVALVCVAAALAAWELCDMYRALGDRPITPLAVLLTGGFVATALIAAAVRSKADTILPMLAQSLSLLCAAIALYWMMRRRDVHLDTGLMISTSVPIFFVGGLLYHAPLLRTAEYGREWILLLLLATFAADTCAYFVGRAIGRTPLAPNISPSKTREGAAGGLAGAVVACVALDAVLGLPATWWQAALMGVAFGVVGQIGDLVVSRIKRFTGVKDSGRLLPGHGGVLDRLDSMMFNLVVLYYFVL